MVRKRSRAARKYYDDDENDSDSDFALEDLPAEPAPKKYSLRQRKRRLFTEFEFDDDGDEIEPTKAPSDDDDFEVERELELDEAADTEYIDKETYINHYEPENEDIPEDADGLIDFEDMIRADIVVNKNRIDYDNIIQKTEIKVQHAEQKVETLIKPIVKSKRGRKPKARPEGEIDSSLLEPETEVQESEFEDKDDIDYNPDDDIDNEDEPIDCATLMEAKLSESANEISIPNKIDTTEDSKERKVDDCLLEKNEPLEKEKSDENSEDVLPNQVAQSSDVNLSNVNLKTNEVNGKVSPPVVSPQVVCPNNFKTTDIKGNEAKSIDTDDDVVLVEDGKKCEVIVLDD